MNPGPARAGLSPVVAGAWRLLSWRAGIAETRDWIAERVDLGVTSFDLRAPAGGSLALASLFGEALAGMPGMRARVQLIGHGLDPRVAMIDADPIDSASPSASATMPTVQATLSALRTDHLDLWLLHRPDPAMDAAAWALALRPLQQRGQVRAFGVSAGDPATLARLHAELPLVAHQFEFSLLQPAPRFDGTLAQAEALHLRSMAWSPMAGGRLFTVPDAPARRVRAVLDARAADLGVPMPVLAMAWLTAQPGRPAPVVGARRAEVVRWALEAVRLPLEAAVQRVLDDAVRRDLVDAGTSSETSCDPLDDKGVPG